MSEAFAGLFYTAPGDAWLLGNKQQGQFWRLIVNNHGLCLRTRLVISGYYPVAWPHAGQRGEADGPSADSLAGVGQRLKCVCVCVHRPDNKVDHLSCGFFISFIRSQHYTVYLYVLSFSFVFV